MRHYEVMVILDPDLEERTVAPSLDTFLNVVKQDGGTVGVGGAEGPDRVVGGGEVDRALRQSRLPSPARCGVRTAGPGTPRAPRGRPALR